MHNFQTTVFTNFTQVAGTKLGKTYLFLEADLDKFIQDYRRPTAKELEAEAFDKLTNQRRA